MSFTKFAVTAAALAGAAMAQSSSCSASGTKTINSPADATGLSSCQTFTGAVAIATSASGQLDFGSLGSIDGDFDGYAPNVTSITAGSLSSVNNFNLVNMSQLYTLSMQQLRSVGSINWVGLAALQQPDFGTGLSEVTSSINVQNTGIQDISSMNVQTVMGDCSIVDNPSLTSLAWTTKNFSSSFIVSGNGPQQLNLSLPNLQAVGKDFDVSNVSSLSIGSLGTVSNLFSVQSSKAQSLLLPNLTSATNINVANNENLQNVSFPMLNMTTGSLDLVNNDKLGGNLQFPALYNIRGGLNITGAFTSVSIPKLNKIGGTCYLWSTQDISSTCNQVSTWQQNGVIAGKLGAGPNVQNGVVCHSMSQSASAAGGSGSSGSSTSGGSSTSSSNAAVPGLVASPATLFGSTGLLAAMLGML